MVTYSTAGDGMIKGQKYEFSFSGLSSDVKPTHEFDGMGIRNGSTFLELDTMKVSMYDEQNERWV